MLDLPQKFYGQPWMPIFIGISWFESNVDGFDALHNLRSRISTLEDRFIRNHDMLAFRIYKLSTNVLFWGRFYRDLHTKLFETPQNIYMLTQKSLYWKGLLKYLGLKTRLEYKFPGLYYLRIILFKEIYYTLSNRSKVNYMMGIRKNN